MIRKRWKKLMAITLSGCLCLGIMPSDTFLISAKVENDVSNTSVQEDSNHVYKVEVDASGNVVSDNASDLEHQTFSWDNVNTYFVLTDRFKNADKSNDHSYGRGLKADGKTAVEGLDTYTNPGTFHGGDLKGLTEEVEANYFNNLGVNAIWITAPYEQIHGYTSGNVKSDNANVYPDPDNQGFPYYSYHGYWTLDYSNIDANMGTAEDFANFVDSCHKHGIRVVMDVVMNHVGYTTMQDAVDYGFDGALKGDWQSYYYGNSTSLMGGKPECQNYWNSESQIWASKWWGPGFVRADYPGYTAAGGGDITMSLCGLPDVMTEDDAPELSSTPPLLVTKWTKEGRLAQEEQELNDFFARTGYKRQARYYIIKWLSDYVREYGVDGFRCDTAKHVDLSAWKALKTECVSALKEWRTNNPTKAGADWTDDFWMTGEAWEHGVGKSSYYSNGFDSMINFSFPKEGNLSSLENVYSSYASMINSDDSFNVLSYVSSHDDAAGAGVFEASDDQSKNLGTSLLLAPGGVQIYYGNEVNRQIAWKNFFTGSDYLDQRYRSDMNWDSINTDVLQHWQKVGQFRNKHLSVGAGQHEKLDGDVYTFARTYHLEENDEDKVVCALPGTAGTYDISVAGVFEDG
ncbi:MAG: alpha-amylase, partial [Lachnospiraceae bacterium]|nr:alpha-amylase [Lachnospiraceae bacterium]